MASQGSRKYLIYDSDDGSQWAYLGDESNIENIVTDDTSVDVQASDLPARRYWVPGNIKKRFARFVSPDGPTKTIVIPTSQIYQDLVAGAAGVSQSFVDGTDGLTYTLQGVTPERIRPVVLDTDSGLNDGDIS